MNYILLCLATLVGAYFINIIYISVFYHRGLAHRSIEMSPWLRRMVYQTGSWVTGVDPKGWVCMHRFHHMYSDEQRDPHSPVGRGIWKVFFAQLNSYKKILAGLIRDKKKYTSIVSDLDFPVHWVNRKQLWPLPYLLHLAIAIGIGWGFSAWALGACYWVGIMSHPFQGWLVNALAHQYGYRNFSTPDNSKNNTLVALFVFGEGYQNNHHHRPDSADFSEKKWEIDFGYWVCLVLAQLKMVNIKEARQAA